MDTAENDSTHICHFGWKEKNVTHCAYSKCKNKLRKYMNKLEYERILRQLRILRNVTWLVKVFPFVGTFVFLLSMVCYRYCDNDISTYLDMLFYTSPMTCVFMLLLSVLLKMCKWHKMQCLLPIAPMLIGVVDDYVYQFSLDAMLANNVIIIAVILMSLFNGYRIFFCNK